MSRRIMPLYLLVLLVIPFTSNAVVIQLPQTGQNTCSDVAGRSLNCSGTGQDGEIRAGLPLPSPRLSVTGDGTVTDLLTGLSWAADANMMVVHTPEFDGDDSADGKVSWQHALDYVARLNGERYLGHNDWRLPNVNELSSLFVAQETTLDAWLNARGFSRVQPDGYWSSTSVAANTLMAWVADFQDGRLYSSRKGANGAALHYVLPVRGEGGLLPATGQTTSLAPADDGALRIGVPLAGRFSDKRDSTVNDELTGLIWTKDGNAPGPMSCGPRRTKVWEDALAYVKCINNARYLGHDDWRLPNRIEMRSVIDYGKGAVADSLRKAGFLNVQADKYWTSTNVMYNAYAWFLDFGDCLVDYRFKTANYYVWPVRGGWGAEAGKYNLTIAIAGSGAVTVQTGTSSTVCTAGMGTCVYPVAPSDTATLTVTPGDGATFAGWSGACSAVTGPCKVKLGGPGTVTATFKPVAP